MNIVYKENIPCASGLYQLYNTEQWNDFLKLPKETLHQTMVNSWYVLNAYDKDELIATGRVISDGFTIALITGLLVHPQHRNKGIGSEIMQRLIQKCQQSRLTIQLFATDDLVSYYHRIGFQPFANGLMYTFRR
ncbi:GNAT family N-acetyltransferase [Shimazuella kribbensis]|uniref:GNAT family N-acetyltransferase n=1 Tax=Shimazuella kribbensis TaxID=139808 RepID=UPI000424598E|nr:GNAT family N-acetyltransferase [Shimazuella kribbensis]